MAIAPELAVTDDQIRAHVDAFYVGSRVPLSEIPTDTPLAMVDSEGITYIAEPVEDGAAHNRYNGRVCFLRVVGHGTDERGDPLIEYPFGEHQPVEIAVDPNTLFGKDMLSADSETVRNGGKVMFFPAKPSRLPRRRQREVRTSTIEDMAVID